MRTIATTSSAIAFTSVRPRVPAERRPQPAPPSGRRVRPAIDGDVLRFGQIQPRGLTDDIRADYHDGVLTLRLRKPEETKPKRISIQHGRKQITEKS